MPVKCKPPHLRLADILLVSDTDIGAARSRYATGCTTCSLGSLADQSRSLVPPISREHPLAPHSASQQPSPDVNSVGVNLTPRQREVLAVMMQGKSNKAICRALNLAEPTVKNHVTAILKALNASNRTEAVIKATRVSVTRALVQLYGRWLRDTQADMSTMPRAAYERAGHTFCPASSGTRFSAGTCAKGSLRERHFHIFQARCARSWSRDRWMIYNVRRCGHDASALEQCDQ